MRDQIRGQNVYYSAYREGDGVGIDWTLGDDDFHTHESFTMDKREALALADAILKALRD